MIFRCPYCHAEVGEKKLPACPSCGKAMRYAVRRTPAERTADKRKIRLMEKQAMRKRSVFDVEATAKFLRSPRKALWAIFVLAIVGMLFFYALKNSNITADIRQSNTEYANQNRAARFVNTLATALARYRFHTGQWPSEETGLAALIMDDGAPGWNGPYITDSRNRPFMEMPRDPWKHPYVYNLDVNGTPVVFSTGPDGVAGTEDDVFADSKSFVLTDMSWTNNWDAADAHQAISVNVRPQPK